MKITVEIGSCKVSVDDGNAPEPASLRWDDQFERIKDLVSESAKHCIALHTQQVGDNKGEQ